MGRETSCSRTSALRGSPRDRPGGVTTVAARRMLPGRSWARRCDGDEMDGGQAAAAITVAAVDARVGWRVGFRVSRRVIRVMAAQVMSVSLTCGNLS